MLNADNFPRMGMSITRGTSFKARGEHLKEIYKARFLLKSGGYVEGTARGNGRNGNNHNI